MIVCVLESEYDYAEDEDYQYTDGAYDGAYYYDEEYNVGKNIKLTIKHILVS